MPSITSLIPVSSGLRPTDVTGIQPRRVGAVNDSVRGESSAPKDLGALDSCDIPRVKPEEENEGVERETGASIVELGARKGRLFSKLRLSLRIATFAALAGAPLAFASGFDLPAKRTDLSEADLARVADITQPTQDFSKAEQYEAMQAGATTSIDPVTEDSFSHISANIPFEEEQNFRLGNALFRKLWVSAPSSTQASDGLGPLFNARSCMSCHVNDGRGKPPEGGPSAVSMVLRLSRAVATPVEKKAIARADVVNFPDPAYGHQLQDLAVPGLAAEGRMTISYHDEKVTLGDGETVSLRRPAYGVKNLAYGPLDPATTISARVAPAMIGLGLIEAIPEADILAHADPDDTDGDGISGKAAIVRDHRSGKITLGRFGWKAQNATVRDQSADAFANDVGISTPDQPDAQGDCTKAEEKCLEMPTGVQKRLGAEEAPGPVLDLVTFYSENLAVPARRKASFPDTLRGKRIFYETGCISCHVPKFVTARNTPDEAQSFQLIWPYSDFLLHDMGDGLADGQQVGLASGREWRTPPLWGIGLTRTVSGHSFFLHDGRARNVTEAILWHGGEAEKARNAFSSLSKDDRAALITFLESL
ncbi:MULTISPECIES: di-heme oxidoredictase family protein [unclassified Rhizobium]|uniref:di-heme oxidoreductase family protein n=1 Tax=unclassified Rhizobium TaxID=2613769 RepID=UPI002180A2F9|nr:MULTISPECIES: di-heme oxidoredictase family protein [unclassified Rhizobium]